VRLLVAGASGRTGRLLVRSALEHGHEVTALLRAGSHALDPHAHLRVVVGDALQPGSLRCAAADQDAVISLLAPRPRKDGRVYVEGTRNLADAAARAGVTRFIAVSAEGAGADPKTLPPAYRLVMRIPVVARLYPEIAQMERELEARTDVEWTIVAPPVLVNAAPTGAYRVNTHGGAVPGGLRLPRADLAAFLLDAAEQGTYIRERVAIAL